MTSTQMVDMLQSLLKEGIDKSFEKKTRTKKDSEAAVQIDGKKLKREQQGL